MSNRIPPGNKLLVVSDCDQSRQKSRIQNLIHGDRSRISARARKGSAITNLVDFIRKLPLRLRLIILIARRGYRRISVLVVLVSICLRDQCGERTAYIIDIFGELVVGREIVELVVHISEVIERADLFVVGI